MMQQTDILNRLLQYLDTCPDYPIREIIHGAHIVAVDSRTTGFSTWAGGRHPMEEDDLNRLTFPEKGSSCKAAAQLILSDNPMTASLGMAAYNSLLPESPPEQIVDKNAADLILEYGKGKRVGVIGHFPFVSKMEGKFEALMVFERAPREGDLHANLISKKIPTADIVAITATTLCNGTLAGILSHCRPNSTKLIVGPTTPLCPAIWDLGFDYAAGSVVKDSDLMKRGILEGKSFRNVKGVRHIILNSDVSSKQ